MAQMTNTLKMDGQLKGKEATLFLGWLNQALGELVNQGVTLELLNEKKQTVLQIAAPDQPLLDQATQLVFSAMRAN